MKPFEELHTAWLDGELSPDAQADFERELIKRGEIADRAKAIAEHNGLQTLLRSHLTVPKLESADFFNHGILEKINHTASNPVRTPGFLGLPKLAWFGGFSMATAFVLFLTIIPKKSETQSQSAYIAQVISARSADPHISATAFQSDPRNADSMTVVWLDGLDYVPRKAN